jgi:hypothetical protein
VGRRLGDALIERLSSRTEVVWRLGACEVVEARDATHTKQVQSRLSGQARQQLEERRVVPFGVGGEVVADTDVVAPDHCAQQLHATGYQLHASLFAQLGEGRRGRRRQSRP